MRRPRTSTSSSPSSPPLTLKRVCTVCPLLRFIRFDSIDDILKIAHVSDTFRDAFESYSAIVWRRIASHLAANLEESYKAESTRSLADMLCGILHSVATREAPLVEFFKRDAFAWAAHNLLTVGHLDVSVMKDHPLRIAAANGSVDVVRA